MYRTPADRPADDVPKEIEYAIESPDRVYRQIGSFIVPVFVALALAAAAAGKTSIVWIALGASLVILWARRQNGNVLVLRVEDGVLAILPRGSKVPKARIRLAELANVELDTKTIRPVEQGGSAIPAMRFADSRIGAEVDRARILFVCDDETSFALSDEYGVHMRTSEAFGKMRVFLRKHGWVPEDEREIEPET